MTPYLRLASFAVVVALAVACGGDPASVVPAPTPTPSPVAVPTPAPSPIPSVDPSPVRVALDDVRLEMVTVAEHIEVPTAVDATAGSPIYIASQHGRVYAVRDGEVSLALDIDPLVASGGEQGLLGLALHPGFETNRRLYVSYTATPDDRSRVTEYLASADGRTIDPASARVILEVEQPSKIHNAGMVAFGPDGLLYLSLGDGGTSLGPIVDPQDVASPLSSIVRIDIDRRDEGLEYAVPPGNPFASGGGSPLIWAYGLRNPWRFSFDRVAGLLYVTDVGKWEYEEINVVPLDQAGVNFGWNLREGPGCFEADTCRTDGLTDPVGGYARGGDSCAIIGGAVYAGPELPGLQGNFFYSDHCGGWLRSIRVEGGQVVESHDWSDQVDLVRPVAIGTTSDGRLFIADGDGRVHHLVPSLR